MLPLTFAVLLLISGALARNEPGPNDPDTYPGKFIKWEVSPGVIIEEDITVPPPADTKAVPKNVKIMFYSKAHPTQAQMVDIENPVASLKQTDFDKSRLTIFVIHGWKNNGDSPVCQLIRDAFLPKKNVNVFVIDWSDISMKNYVSARMAVSQIGGFVGEFIKVIAAGNGLKMENTRLIGHSLGAHVSGFAGAKTDSKVGEIIGLDPAFPMFYFSKPGERLSYKDARFVQVIHTCGYLLGFPYSIGHSDYYPNGGNSQAGCFLDPTGQCAHARAYIYYQESLLTGSFVSNLCDSYKNYEKGECKTKPKSNMGEYTTDIHAKGDYYLDTNPEAPFAKGG